MLQYFLFNDHSRTFVPIRDGMVFGRSSGDLQFREDGLISREHCRIRLQGSSVYIEDLASTNGTKVNSVKIIARRSRRIQFHDVIEIGRQRLILTAQNRHTPALTRDEGNTTTVFHAVRKENGELSSVIPKALAQIGAADRTDTFIGLGREEHQQLQRKRFSERVRRSLLHPALLLVLGSIAAFIGAVRYLNQ
jgi:pSer/pThr/pTyr-binding forkhead associated (FHA) protein